MMMFGCLRDCAGVDLFYGYTDVVKNERYMKLIMQIAQVPMLAGRRKLCNEFLDTFLMIVIDHIRMQDRNTKSKKQ